MSKVVVVLGCGLIGETMARDLAREPSFRVCVADTSEANLSNVAAEGNIETRRADVSEPAVLSSLIENADIVLGALPSVLGFRTLQRVINAGRPYCDISFMPENALTLDSLATKRGVTAVVDCGVSPGLSNLFVGHGHTTLDATESAEILVGGLPKVAQWPYFYKAPFAPSDVIEEYTRPARLVENGRVVTKAALSEPELIDFPQAGTLEAFNTDGLRSLIATMRIPNMKEKTLRHPGHIELMRVFRDTGLFDKEAIEIKGTCVRPLDVTSALLFPRWQFEPGEREFTVLKVVVAGMAGTARKRIEYTLFDEYDEGTGTSSMARTTAFPAAIMARAIVDGSLTDAGVLPLERLAPRRDLFDRMLRELAARNVDVQIREIDG